MEAAEDFCLLVLSEEICDTVVPIQEDTDLAIRLNPVDVADFGKLHKSLRSIIDAGYHLLGGLGTILSM